MDNNNNPVNKQNSNLKKLYSFFCWCSGVRLYLLKRCPTEYNKYFGIGAIVFFTGSLAALTGGYAIYTVFENPAISMLLGLFWGVLIFFLDWYIVSSLRKENQIGKELLSATPRLILSIFLAIVISKPLELRLFQNEIMKEIEVLKRDHELNYQSMVFEEFDEISQLENENKQLYEMIRKKEQERMNLFNLIVEEAEGRSPTQAIGKGPVYKEKKIEYDKVSAELEQLNNTYLTQIQLNQKRINDLKLIRDQKIENGYGATSNYDGFLARLEALGSLTSKNQSIYIANIFLILLFVLLESAPIIVKLMSKRGPYDILLDSEEISKTYESENEIKRWNNILNEEVETKRKNKRFNKDVKDKILDDYYQKLTEAGIEINQVKINKWKEKETKKINENFEEESGNISNSLKAH